MIKAETFNGRPARKKVSFFEDIGNWKLNFFFFHSDNDCKTQIDKPGWLPVVYRDQGPPLTRQKQKIWSRIKDNYLLADYKRDELHMFCTEKHRDCHFDVFSQTV